jgi:small subunit ribosomal protein S8
MMTDPIADLLTRIRNGAQARHQSVDVPWSRVKERIARVMEAEGFIGEVASVGEGKDRVLRLTLRYDGRRTSVITGLRRVSRPSLRVYVGVGDIAPVRDGLGVSILSTSKGIMVDREARSQGVGGEVLCSIW